MAQRGLLSAKWLSEKLRAGGLATGLRVLDASWYLPKQKRDARAEFKERHIPEAAFFDLDQCSDRTSPYDHMLPSADAFAQYVGKLGIDSRTHVVVYDGSDWGSFSAPRVWWMFRAFGHRDVSVLDGGLRNWIREGNPVSGEAPSLSPGPGEFRASLNSAWVKKYEQVLENVETKEFQVVDARSEGRFRGTEPEPREGTEPGHIPGSVNMPFYTFLTESGMEKNPEELRAMFQEKSVDLGKPVLVTCGSGVTACHIALAAFLCGKEDVMVFDGAWVEWFTRASPENVVSEGKRGV
ncbi:3-mercaptopyruvate sulfurtransferase [Latimeria chalumnae]|uniref:Sulfurtransferase n=1 Tax=Latimeria chalumnae TaxID=7897 RepID=M3XGV3_LATCH|nr:PREDICTED: 3-mercaptopyruvate sulfurtransferase [Latimeria chalumnae]|eukprot:XP_006006937.1 PREDICTED: 3-mercaptopyruvate sulfurtransferase [Latimeria chalumnae]